MKPLFPYWGGKQAVSEIIVPMIPKHSVYVEPFAGSAAVFFRKPQIQNEVLCDLSYDVINFFKCSKFYFTELCCLAINMNYSNVAFDKCRKFLEKPINADCVNIRRAAAYWYCQVTSYNAMGTKGTVAAYSTHKKTESLANKKKLFSHEYSMRLQNTKLICANAVDVILAYDSPGTFFYLDPPYFNAEQAYANNYEHSDYLELLSCISNLRGKFILSGYPSHILYNYTKLFKWKTSKHELYLSSGSGVGRIRNKVEELTRNY